MKLDGCNEHNDRAQYLGVISLAGLDLSVKHEGLVASLHYVLHPPRVAELRGARGALAPLIFDRHTQTLRVDNQLLRIPFTPAHPIVFLFRCHWHPL